MLYANASVQVDIVPNVITPTTLGTYVYTRRSLEAFIKKKFKTSNIVFGQLSE